MKLSQKEKDKYHTISLICNLIYGTNEPFHGKETHELRKQTCGCQGGEGGSGMDGESRIDRCKLLPLKWINNGDPAV